jgi:hypothetical protein
MRIGLCSTMSCGKTTLIKAIAELPQFNNYFIATERSKYLRDLGIPLNTDSTLEGQTMFLAERVSELFNPNLLTDRTIIDVIAFTNSAQSISSADKNIFQLYASKFIPRYDWVFYISPEGIPIEDNSIRETDPIYRDKIDKYIRYFIKENFLSIKNYGVLKGSTEERITQILNYTKL